MPSAGAGTVPLGAPAAGPSPPDPRSLADPYRGGGGCRGAGRRLAGCRRGGRRRRGYAGRRRRRCREDRRQRERREREAWQRQHRPRRRCRGRGLAWGWVRPSARVWVSASEPASASAWALGAAADREGHGRMVGHADRDSGQLVHECVRRREAVVGRVVESCRRSQVEIAVIDVVGDLRTPVADTQVIGQDARSIDAQTCLERRHIGIGDGDRQERERVCRGGRARHEQAAAMPTRCPRRAAGRRFAASRSWRRRARAASPGRSRSGRRPRSGAWCHRSLVSTAKTRPWKTSKLDAPDASAASSGPATSMRSPPLALARPSVAATVESRLR